MKKLLGGILLAVGVLIMGLSGLCTLSSILIGMGGGSGTAMLGWAVLAIVVGGIPFAFGLALFLLGRWLIRASDDAPEQD